MAFAGAMLLTCCAGTTPTLAIEKLKTVAVSATDPVTLRAASRTAAYLRSLQGFQVISSASLEEVVDEIGEKVTTRSAPSTWS